MPTPSSCSALPCRGAPRASRSPGPRAKRLIKAKGGNKGRSTLHTPGHRTVPASILQQTKLAQLAPFARYAHAPRTTPTRRLNAHAVRCAHMRWSPKSCAHARYNGETKSPRKSRTRKLTLSNAPANSAGASEKSSQVSTHRLAVNPFRQRACRYLHTTWVRALCIAP